MNSGTGKYEQLQGLITPIVIRPAGKIEETARTRLTAMPRPRKRWI
jgi:hypothetical protein